MKRFTLVSLIVIALTCMAQAQTPQSNITVTKAWSRATASAASAGVVYFTATDAGAPDRLTAASTPFAAKAQLHESKMENGIMKMRPIDGLAISKDIPITLAPGGYHLMLTGLTQALKAGQTFPLTLTFEHAGAITTTVTVAKADTAGSNMGTMPVMNMKDMDMGGMTK